MTRVKLVGWHQRQLLIVGGRGAISHVFFVFIFFLFLRFIREVRISVKKFRDILLSGGEATIGAIKRRRDLFQGAHN